MRLKWSWWKRLTPRKKPQKAEDLGLEKLRFQHERCEEGVLWEV